MRKLLLALLLGSPALAYAQPEPVNLSNNPGRRAHGFTVENEELPARNHGTGLRVGALWSDARAAATSRRLPASYEIGAFHQHQLSRALSLQGEALLYRENRGGQTSSGLRLPALLVVNPFYNLSIHAGPQLQWRTSGNRPYPTTTEFTTSDAPVPAGSRLSAALVVGAEARVGFLRVGVRYGLPFRELTDLSATGDRFADSWKTGQVQAYLGAGF